MQRVVVPGRLKSAKYVEDFKATHREEDQHQLGFFCSGDGVSIGLPDAEWFSPSLQLLRKKRSKPCERVSVCLAQNLYFPLVCFLLTSCDGGYTVSRTRSLQGNRRKVLR